MRLVQALVVIGKCFDYPAVAYALVTTAGEHALQFALERSEPLDSVLHGGELCAGDLVGLLARLRWMMPYLDQGENRVDIEVEFACLPDNAQALDGV